MTVPSEPDLIIDTSPFSTELSPTLSNLPDMVGESQCTYVLGQDGHSQSSTWMWPSEPCFVLSPPPTGSETTNNKETTDYHGVATLDNHCNLLIPQHADANLTLAKRNPTSAGTVETSPPDTAAGEHLDLSTGETPRQPQDQSIGDSPLQSLQVVLRGYCPLSLLLKLWPESSLNANSLVGAQVAEINHVADFCAAVDLNSDGFELYYSTFDYYIAAADDQAIVRTIINCARTCVTPVQMTYARKMIDWCLKSTTDDTLDAALLHFYLAELYMGLDVRRSMAHRDQALQIVLNQEYGPSQAINDPIIGSREFLYFAGSIFWTELLSPPKGRRPRRFPDGQRRFVQSTKAQSIAIDLLRWCKSVIIDQRETLEPALQAELASCDSFKKGTMACLLFSRFVQAAVASARALPPLLSSFRFDDLSKSDISAYEAIAAAVQLIFVGHSRSFETWEEGIRGRGRISTIYIHRIDALISDGNDTGQSFAQIYISMFAQPRSLAVQECQSVFQGCETQLRKEAARVLESLRQMKEVGTCAGRGGRQASWSPDGPQFHGAAAAASHLSRPPSSLAPSIQQSVRSKRSFNSTSTHSSGTSFIEYAMSIRKKKWKSRTSAVSRPTASMASRDSWDFEAVTGMPTSDEEGAMILVNFIRESQATRCP